MRTSIRRLAVALGVTIGMFAIAGPGAQAATTAPPPLRASADAQALRISLTLPSVNQLKTALTDAGVDLSKVDLSSVPVDLDTPTTLQIVVSLAHGDVYSANRNVASDARTANGWAKVLSVTLNGSPLDLTQNMSIGEASSFCHAHTMNSTAQCGGSDVASSSTGNVVPSGTVPADTTVTLPLGLGYIDIAPVSSTTKTLTATTNEVGLVKVHLDVRSLFGTGAPLEAIGNALNSVTSTINSTVIPQVNQVIGTVAPTLNGVVPDVTVNPMRDLPMITDGSLLDLTVLPASANISPAKTGSTLLDATGVSKIVDLSVLNTDNPALSAPWVSAKALSAYAEAKALTDGASVSDPKNIRLADARQSFVAQGVDLGGLVSVDNSGLDAIKGGLKTIVRNLGTKIGDPAGYENLTNIAAFLDSVSGVSLTPVQGLLSTPKSFHSTKISSPAIEGGKHGTRTISLSDLSFNAKAVSDSLQLLVQPALPNINDLKAAVSAGSLDTSSVHFAPTGISLEVDMPNAQAFVAQGAQVEALRFARTGVAGPMWFAAALLFGAAIIVRRFITRASK